MALHQELAAGRWYELSLVEQMGNIGSEIGRAIKGRADGNTERMWDALVRGLELFDLTIADSRWRHRLKEIVRAREVVCDYLVGNNICQSTADSLENYFLQFAIGARKGR